MAHQAASELCRLSAFGGSSEMVQILFKEKYESAVSKTSGSLFYFLSFSSTRRRRALRIMQNGKCLC
jgi:hypothetical protein